MTESYTFELGTVPKSLNAISSRGSRWAYIKEKKRWEDMLWPMLELGKLPRPMKHVLINVWLRFPVRRRRDTGNFAWILEKAVGDVLVKRGFLVDDTPEYFQMGVTRFDGAQGPPRTTIEVVWNSQTTA